MSDKPQRILNESEIDEQTRLQAKRILMAYFHDSEPYGEKVKQAANYLREETMRLQIKSANIRAAMNVLPHMPKNEKETKARDIWQRMLPT